MNEKSINEQYSFICSFLKERRLKEALTQLESLLWQYPDWDLRMRLEQIQSSYKYMLDYMKQGINDAERWSLHRKMMAETWEIADHARILLLDKVSTQYYHELRRTPPLPAFANTTLRQVLHILESFRDDLAVSGLLSDEKTDEVLKRHEDTLKYMFSYTWTQYAWTAEENEDAHAMLASTALPIHDLCQFTSAVMLSTLSCFDLRKINWLLDAYSHASSHVSQRALIGIMIAFHQHADRLTLYPELAQRINVMEEHPTFLKDLKRLYRQMLLCQETEKIDKKMREEIIPEAMKKAIDINILKRDIDANEEKNDGFNPDWQDKFDIAGINEILREMTNLQREGADVNMSTFSSLKNYPFFNDINNWFYPFDMYQPDVYRILKNKENGLYNLVRVVLNSIFFSDSDKYSFFFTISQVPYSQKGVLYWQFSEYDTAALEDKEAEKKIIQINELPEQTSNQYLHDLYRFYKLNVHRNDFTDIFKQKLFFHHISLFKPLLMNREVLFPLADFFLKKSRWEDAIQLFEEMEQLPKTETDPAEFYQKYGYALQKKKRYQEAIDIYLKAEILKPNNIWNNHHLATCYRISQNYADALLYYRKVEEATPDNANVIFYIGHCLAELKKYEEALNCFFKLDFMENNSVRAWRGIGWCSFVCHKYEQAQKYYSRVIEQNPTAVDYMNSGHAAWAMGQIEQAITAYGKGITMTGNRKKFIQMFMDDQDVLIDQGISREDIPLMLDLI